MASYPSSAAGDAQLSIAVNSLQTTLSGSIDSVVTSVTLASATGFPSTGYVTIDSEVISYTGISTNTLTGCTRGADGTTAASHNSGVPVSATIVAAHHNSLKNEMEAVETDLVAAFGSITPTTTNATDTTLTNRIKSLANQIKVGFGLTNWYDTISATFLKADLSNIGTVANDLPMNGHKVTGLAAATANGDATRFEQTVLTSTDQTITGVKTFSGQLIGKGTATNDDAAAGYIGEYVAATVTSTTNFASTATYKNIASISLTVGDWDVVCLVNTVLNGATMAEFRTGISTDSGTTFSDEADGDNASKSTPPTSTSNQGKSVPGVRKSLSGTTTFYHKLRGDFSAGTPQYDGSRISARRVR